MTIAPVKQLTVAVGHLVPPGPTSRPSEPRRATPRQTLVNHRRARPQRLALRPRGGARRRDPPPPRARRRVLVVLVSSSFASRMADADVETRACELARGLGKRGPALFSPTPSTRDDEDADAARRDGDRAKKILSLVRVLLTGASLSSSRPIARRRVAAARRGRARARRSSPRRARCRVARGLDPTTRENERTRVVVVVVVAVAVRPSVSPSRAAAAVASLATPTRSRRRPIASLERASDASASRRRHLIIRSPAVRRAAAKKVKEDAEPAEILPGVFLGSIGAAHNEDALRRHRITHVLTVASSFAPRFPDAYEYLVVDVADAPSENLRAHFERCLKFIARARLDGVNVLVHCFAGRSRSATIVAAYAMATEGTSLEETMRAMKEKRPTAGPNRGFAAQLRAFERELTERRRDGRLLGRLQLDALAAAAGGGGKEG